MTPNATPAADAIVTIDRFAPHISTVPATRGQTVGLFVREKVLAAPPPDGKPRPIVLFIHGGYSPAIVAYDLDYKDYSVMAALARDGFDVFCMTHTGYGSSPKPMMDDPYNVDPAFQHLLIPHVLKEPVKPRYPFKLVSSRTEFDEIETVVKFIMDLRGAARINLFGWSTGCPRTGGFAALHPDKVDRLVLVAPAQFFPTDTPPDPFPEPGAPMILQSYDMLMQKRWQDDVRCEGQVDDWSVRDVMWKELMAQDGLGAEWTSDGRGIMRAPNRMNFGWRANVPKIKAPTLIMLGEFDNYEPRRDSWKALKAERRVFIKLECASHFVPYERGRHVMKRAAIEWFRHASIDGAPRAELYADPDGKLHELAPAPA
jgi:pimeloyl-ACP methyl ester carboxylesterase